MQNIIEYSRKLIVEDLFNTPSFHNVWPIWRKEIRNLTSIISPISYFNLGDNLVSVFRSTSEGGRTQSSLSAGGIVWESLVTWYLNLMCIGRRTLVIKHKRTFVPSPVRDAITVTYNNFDSNTESDVIAITFPNHDDFLRDKEELVLYDSQGNRVELYMQNGEFKREKVMDALCEKHFTSLEIHIIQCKTNWNDNAQIPMLWDMVYSAQGFGRNINVGKNGKSIKSVKDFSYSFVTVPTNSLDKYSASSTAVLRVNDLSGGNYWGNPSRTAVARSVKELATQNLSSGHDDAITVTLQKEIKKLSTDYSYFNL